MARGGRGTALTARRPAHERHLPLLSFARHAQPGAKKHCLPKIDLVIYDEAHSTTGASFESDEIESSFVHVHDDGFLKTTKRLAELMIDYDVGGCTRETYVLKRAYEDYFAEG